LNQERLANQELILINDDDQALIQLLNEGGRIGKIVDLKVARDAGKKTGSKRKCRDEVENRRGGKKQKPPPSALEIDDDTEEGGARIYMGG
jgi:hypothetical protein